MFVKLKQYLINYMYLLHTGHRPRIISGSLDDTGKISPGFTAVCVLLFLATFFTATLSAFLNEFLGDVEITKPIIEYFFEGLPYSITLMLILLFHEFGHFFAAKRFNVASTLPIFIPSPLLFGTMGAVIKMKSSIPSRRALLYIGAMGPLPGFLVSLLAVIIGISNSSIVSVANFDSSQIAVGESLLFSMIVKLIHGTIPAGCDLLLSPIAWAGWVGFFVTSLNLLPIGQLDGGHILYGLLGKKQVYAGWLAFFILVFFSFKWFGWVIWIFLSMTILMIAHPEIPEGEKPSILEKAMGYFCVIILIVTFMPVPIKLP